LNRALRLAFQTLNVSRVMVAAQSLGLALAAFREASRRAVERRAFGQSIIDNQGIGFKLADMAVEISAARMMLSGCGQRCLCDCFRRLINGSLVCRSQSETEGSEERWTPIMSIIVASGAFSP
jgi:alkylation response protein AidB-like acyl-CoA dehydrogenase